MNNVEFREKMEAVAREYINKGDESMGERTAALMAKSVVLLARAISTITMLSEDRVKTTNMLRTKAIECLDNALADNNKQLKMLNGLLGALGIKTPYEDGLPTDMGDLDEEMKKFNATLTDEQLPPTGAK